MFVRSGASPQEERAVSRFYNGSESHTEISNSLQEGATRLAKQHGFFPGDKTGSEDKIRLIGPSDLQILKRNPTRTKEFMQELRDFENARFAVQALARTDQEDYWNDRIFKAKYAGNNTAGFCRLSDTIKGLIEDTGHAAGPLRSLGIKGDRGGISASLALGPL